MTASMIGQYRSVQAFFASVIDEAARSLGVRARPELRAYLVRVLERFASPRSGRFIGEPLVLLLQRAETVAGSERRRRLRELGDLALFAGGFFSEVFERRGVAESYVRAMGREAYLRAASMTRAGVGAVRGDLLRELGHRFDELSTVLDHVRGATAIGDAEDVAQLLDRWLRSPRAGHHIRLLRRGVVPLDGPEGSQ